MSRPALGKHDGQETLMPQQSFVRPHLVQPLAFRDPPTIPEFEESRCVSRGKVRLIGEGIRREAYADQHQQATRLSISRPDELIIPLGILPAEAFDRIDTAQRREEPSLEPFALGPKLQSGSLFSHLPYDEAKDPSASEDEHDRRDWEYPCPEEPSHARPRSQSKRNNKF
jgi:hypothetical protein